MDMKLLQDQGRSIADELQLRLKNTKQAQISNKAKNITNNTNKIPATDTFEKTETKTETSNTVDKKQSEDGKLNVSFQFDLFYELSQKVETKMGQKGLNKFVETTGQVSETFMGDFSLEIDGVGSFMKSTDDALNISPEVTDKFLDSVNNLADLSPEALQGFLQESENYFGELKEKYGNADGTFDTIKDQMQTQAKQFFSDVDQVKRNAIGLSDETSNNTALPQSQEVPTDTKQVSSKPITFTARPDVSISQDSYKNDFLQQFLNYTEKFQQDMMKNFLDYKPLTTTSLEYKPNTTQENSTSIDTSV